MPKQKNELGRNIVDKAMKCVVMPDDKQNGNVDYFEVVGTTDTYGVRWDDKHRVSCTCPYSSLHPDAMCSHKIAVVLYKSRINELTNILMDIDNLVASARRIKNKKGKAETEDYYDLVNQAIRMKRYKEVDVWLNETSGRKH